MAHVERGGIRCRGSGVTEMNRSMQRDPVQFVDEAHAAPLGFRGLAALAVLATFAASVRAQEAVASPRPGSPAGLAGAAQGDGLPLAARILPGRRAVSLV